MATSSSAPTTKSADRRGELAEAAYRLIAARGLEGLSMRVLAREVGATTGLVTHHFLDRGELIAAALDHATMVMRARANRATADRPTPLDAIAAILPTDAESVENWRFALSVRAGALVDPTLRSFDSAIHRYWHRYLPPALDEQTAIDPSVPAAEAVDHLVAVVDGIALRAVLQPRKWPKKRQLAHVRRAFASLAIPLD